MEECRDACAGVQVVLHQAALGSVPRSLEDPVTTNVTNIDGFLNMLVAARDSGVERFVCAASSSTYRDHEALPKREDVIGLRYFTVFCPRQDPNGAYVAVIPQWFSAIRNGGGIGIGSRISSTIPPTHD